MYSEVLLKVDLVHAAKRTKKIADSRPQSFNGVVVHLTDSVAIVISRPFALARCMAYRDMSALRPGQMMVGAPFVGIDRSAVLGGLQNTRLKILSCTVFLKAIGSGRFRGRRLRLPRAAEGRHHESEGKRDLVHSRSAT